MRRIYPGYSKFSGFQDSQRRISGRMIPTMILGALIIFFIELRIYLGTLNQFLYFGSVDE